MASRTGSAITTTFMWCANRPLDMTECQEVGGRSEDDLDMLVVRYSANKDGANRQRAMDDAFGGVVKLTERSHSSKEIDSAARPFVYWKQQADVPKMEARVSSLIRRIVNDGWPSWKGVGLPAAGPTKALQTSPVTAKFSRVITHRTLGQRWE
ncbi:hypothetical protein Bbelb_034750 [Branchiostoma belcheri]|nr:hypothetical protein Bbelb_034750 [Branchiostoma belcheri]